MNNVQEFGAKGDGVTDDTDAIQAAINAVSERGGGKIFFPYTRTGYRIAKPAHRLGISKDIRQNVLAISRKYGYHPHFSARAKKRSGHYSLQCGIPCDELR